MNFWVMSLSEAKDCWFRMIDPAKIISRHSWLRHTAALLVLLCSMIVIQHFYPISKHDGGYESTTMMLGFILLIAYLAGLVVSNYGLPKITGYLFVGILFGPSVLGYVTENVVQNLKLVNGMAVALIALTAGGEIKLSRIRHIKKSLIYISAVSMLVIFIGMFLATILFRNQLSFLGIRGALPGYIAVGLLVATIFMASSPTVAIAVINDTGAKGRVSDLILGTTVIKDLVVVITFAVTMSFSIILVDPGMQFDFYSLIESIGVVLISLILGLFLGWLLGLYVKNIGTEMVLVVLGFCLLVAELGLSYHLEPLSICLATGFFIENYSGHTGDELITAIKKLSLPVYVIFFSVVGLGLKIQMLMTIWSIALFFVLIRMVLTYSGTVLGARMGKASPKMLKYGWMGFISQAGVSLGLAITISRTFPGWGSRLEMFIIAIITVHEIIGPVLLKYALDRSGETKRKDYLMGAKNN